MLTKLKCLISLENLKDEVNLRCYVKKCQHCGHHYVSDNNTFGCVIKDSTKRLEQLINEHFDNPPLEFGELHEGMWVWDNKEEEYKRIGKYDRRYELYWIHAVDSPYGYKLYADEFHKNRYFRKQVEEDVD